MALNSQQQRFVEEYLVDLNATQAAIRAGYSEDTAKQQGSRLLTNVDVGKAVADAIAERSVRTRVTADRVLTELARIGFGDIRSVVAWRANTAETGKEDEDGVPETRAFNEVELIGSDIIDHDAAAAIAEISQGKDGALKVKMHNKVAALQEMGRHLGIAQKVEPVGPDGAPPVFTFKLDRPAQS
ncbi:terminase small subunit [Methylorubrum populi]|uniref:Phage terminase small subunit n=1 Tax=Methylorubrum populi TaxID=223967 RepID=A0A833JCF8_9HYPH|nr:terminase small subunit [Methylorubrum populi]KAB7788027.1 Phage terminase small subunit [Methylorubrum populi]